MEHIVTILDKYGFPILAVGGIGYMIFYVWNWATQEVKPVLDDANDELIKLIDRIRMLENDNIRLQQKVNVVLELRGKTLEIERMESEQHINEKYHINRTEEK